jgi:hypothetical protein
MTRSFSSLCITNAICLTLIWIIIGLAMFGTKMQKDQDFHDFLLKIKKDNIHMTNQEFFEGSWRNNLPYLSLTTVSKSLIWLGFVLETVVCFIEFMVVCLKVQAPPVEFYSLSACRYLNYILSVIFHYLLISDNSTGAMIIFQLVIWTLCRIIQTCYMWCMNKVLSDEVDGKNNPVIHAIGPTGNKAGA